RRRTRGRAARAPARRGRHPDRGAGGRARGMGPRRRRSSTAEVAVSRERKQPFASGEAARYSRRVGASDRTPECLEQLRAGGLVLVVDSASEPPEAVVACSGARVTPEVINL